MIVILSRKDDNAIIVSTMDISFLGHSSFKIKTKNAVVVTDPFSPEMTSLKFPKTEADIVTISHDHKDHNFLTGVDGTPFVINAPGEYEVKSVSFFGFPSSHGGKTEKERIANTIFLIEADELSICHLGDLGETPSAKIMEEIIGVDVLMIPVGGIYTLNPKEAVEIISKIEPRIVLPMHFKTPALSELADLFEFLKEMGAEQAEKLDKLSLTKDKLPEETKVLVLEKKG